jgi:hypothetical protein
MAQDYFAELKKQSYPLFTAPKPYSFDLNEDMVQMLKAEYNAEKVVAAMMAAVKDKKGDAEVKAAEAFFKDMGEKWMRRTIQLGDEYSDRTIEMIMETVDRQGKQFLIFPHLHQRYVEVANLAVQDFLKVPITLNNAVELAYRIPRCAVYGKIKEKAGEAFAKHMTCSQFCMAGLATIQKQISDIDVISDQPAKTAKEGFCEFTVRKL